MPEPDARSTAECHGAGRQGAVAAFLLARWRGEIPLRVALWWDMWCVGTVVNLAAALAALLLLARDAPDGLGAAVYFAPLPYNLFLLVSLWRSAARTGGPAAAAARLLAGLWFVLAVLL